MEKFNRNSGFTLSLARYPATDMLTNQERRPGRVRTWQPISPHWLAISYKASALAGIYMTQADILVVEFAYDKNTDGSWKHHFTCCSNHLMQLLAQDVFI